MQDAEEGIGRRGIAASRWWRKEKEQRRAGESAKAQYELHRKEWLRRNRSVFARLALLTTAVVLLSNAAYLRVWHLPWLAGFMAGAGFAGWIAIRQHPPGWIENWELGAWGEQQTAKELRKLPASWVVINDVKAGKGNIDHLVIGPPGVFLLDSKRWSGQVAVRGDQVGVQLWEDGPTKRYEPSRHSLALSRETHDRVLRETRITLWVQPVIVIWGNFPQGSGGDRCRFVAGTSLVDWLMAQPQRIADHRVPRVAQAVSQSWAATKTSDGEQHS